MCPRWIVVTVLGAAVIAGCGSDTPGRIIPPGATSPPQLIMNNVTGCGSVRLRGGRQKRRLPEVPRVALHHVQMPGFSLGPG